MKTVHWYFDFISPYAYLQSRKLQNFVEANAMLRCKPVLFAGLLKHWGQKGPAEMATKRTFTYQQIAWYAQRHHIQLKWPQSHPFNPLPLLRLCELFNNDLACVERLFAYVWRDGFLPTDEAPWAALLEELKVNPEDLDHPELKDAIRANTEEALSKGVFGVPSCIIEDDGFETYGKPSGKGAHTSPIFWGFDATEMVMAWIHDHPDFEADSFVTASQVGAGVVRRT